MPALFYNVGAVLEVGGQPVFEAEAELLLRIKEHGSLARAAEALSLSYKAAWLRLRKLEGRLGRRLVRTFRGGAMGGGASLTEFGEEVLRRYLLFKSYLRGVLEDEEYWEALCMKISARNRLKGIVRSVEKGDVAARVSIEIETPCVITALITREAVETLDIKEGDEVEAVIKATEVMVAKE